MPTDPKLLEIAARIDEVLVQELGQHVDLARMLAEPRYARDVLLVCEACRGTELLLLGREFRRVARELGAVEARGGHARQATEWSNTSTGFGVSRPLDSRPVADASISPGTLPPALPGAEPAPGPSRRWLARWLKR